MRKYSVVFILTIILVLFVILFYKKGEVDINGRMLLNMNDNGITAIDIYDYSQRDFEKLSLRGLQAKFLNDNIILINRFDSIVEYDLNTKKESIVYKGDSFDFFNIRMHRQLSITKGNYIFLYDTETKEKKAIIDDNGSMIHSWSNDGDLLYYSDTRGTIKCISFLTGKVKELGEGYNPIISHDNIAYKNKDKLIVKDLQTNKEYEYNGSTYSYCFSPKGEQILVETEMTTITGIKNLFNGGVVIGHSVVVWEYESNKKSTVIEACPSVPDLICDWQM